jgi:hypothetical protein
MSKPSATSSPVSPCVLHEVVNLAEARGVFLEAIALGDDFFPARVFVEGQLLVSFGLILSRFRLRFSFTLASASPSPSAADDSAAAVSFLTASLTTSKAGRRA